MSGSAPFIRNVDRGAIELHELNYEFRSLEHRPNGFAQGNDWYSYRATAEYESEEVTDDIQAFGNTPTEAMNNLVAVAFHREKEMVHSAAPEADFNEATQS